PDLFMSTAPAPSVSSLRGTRHTLAAGWAAPELPLRARWTAPVGNRNELRSAACAVAFEKGVNRRPVVRLVRDGAFKPSDLRTFVLDDGTSQGGLVVGKHIREVLEHPQGMRRDRRGALQHFAPVAAQFGELNACALGFVGVDRHAV